MSYYALWIDHHHAFVYKYTAQGVEESKLEAAHHANHHTHSAGDMKHKEHEKFFHQVATKLADAEELMIMGPGVAKDEFKHHCENHQHHQISKSIVGVQPMAAHPTKAMMLEKAKDFFKSYHLWTKNY